MKIRLVFPALIAACLGFASSLHAQTLSGTWQATLGNIRGVTKFTRASDGSFHGEAYYLGPELGGTRNGNPISVVEVKGRHVYFAFDQADISFDGDLSADGNTLSGTSNGTPLTFNRAMAKTAWAIDPSPHKVLFVPVEKGVRLEVLDWGGNGPPLVFVPGLGNTAHTFDDIAPMFTAKHHVYGVTRRGFGLSDWPAPTPENYDADRMGDDVLAVIGALKLDRPVIAGHSLGGEELSSIGTRHPEKVSGLVYLDAAYEYAFYDPGGPKTWRARSVDFSMMRRDLMRTPSASPSEAKGLILDMQALLPVLQKDLQKLREDEQGISDPPMPPKMTLRDHIIASIQLGMRRYSAVKAPVLAIAASPHACAGNCDTPQYKADEADLANQVSAFQAGTPQARVVRIANANHFVFWSNEAQVVSEMNAFMDGLH